MKNTRLSSQSKSTIFKSVLGWLLIVIYLFPVYWMINTSFKTGKEMFANPPTLIRKSFTSVLTKLFSREIMAPGTHCLIR